MRKRVSLGTHLCNTFWETIRPLPRTVLTRLGSHLPQATFFHSLNVYARKQTFAKMFAQLDNSTLLLMCCNCWPSGYLVHDSFS